MVNYYASLRHHFDETSLLGFEPYMGLNVGTQEINDNEETMSGVDGHPACLSQKRAARSGYPARLQQRPGILGRPGLRRREPMFAVSGRESDSEPRTAEPAEVVSQDSDGDGVIDARRPPRALRRTVVDDRGLLVYDVRREETVKTIYFEFDQSTSGSVQQRSAQPPRSARRRRQPDPCRRPHRHRHPGVQPGPVRAARQFRDELIQEYQVESGVIDQGYGERRPVPNDTAEGREQNRRADIVVESEEKEAKE